MDSERQEELKEERINQGGAFGDSDIAFEAIELQE